VTQLRAVIAEQGLNWSVVQVGARVELVFSNHAPKNASHMRKLIDPLWLKAFHLFLINEGILIAPFHNMMLISANTSLESRERLVSSISIFGKRAAGLL
jgi:glutamate-1-semialdehyde 2,1-aminomutase